ncbi:4-hydroxy-tetrahydrodipicolinate reductase [Micavibrio aeruginosavorus]|nr:4-hydroxy-tetrahydrodipicolinate reductase [Micavibrio aeruginosavorus]
MIKVGIAGYRGRMGQMLVHELQSGQWPGLAFGSGSESSDNPNSLFAENDLVIDFTTPIATRAHVDIAVTHKKPIIIGTTGLNDNDMTVLKTAATTCPVLYSANMSVGVNLLAALVEQASARLGDTFDIEIMETHHRNKMDSPSGTALMLGRATGRPNAPMDRSGKRNTGTVGYAVQRGGDVAGEHNVSFFGPGERIELGHRAHDRSLFAKGALRAALWMKGRPAGLYSMRDVLGL